MNRVEGHPNLYKNPTTGVIVNREVSDRDRYRLAKNQASSMLDAQMEIEELKESVRDLSSIRGEIDELKDLIHQLLRK